MAIEMMELPPAGRRRVTMDALAELAQGGLAERLRQEVAARALSTVRRALDLTGASLPMPPGMVGWDWRVTTAREHVETLTPGEVDRLLAEAPRWAAALLRAQPAEQRRAA